MNRREVRATIVVCVLTALWTGAAFFMLSEPDTFVTEPYSVVEP